MNSRQRIDFFYILFPNKCAMSISLCGIVAFDIVRIGMKFLPPIDLFAQAQRLWMEHSEYDSSHQTDIRLE